MRQELIPLIISKADDPNDYPQGHIFREKVASMSEPVKSRDQLPLQSGSFFTPQMTDTVFWRPRFMTDTPLMPHAPFLFWLVKTVRPHNVAVFGGGDAAALFALCQAMDKLNIAGRCLGVGFRGDSVTGIPDALREHAEMLYDDLLSWRSDSDPREAMAVIAPSSLDLLFIDASELPEGGMPSLEDWESLLHPDGIIIIHGEPATGPAQGHALQALAAGRPVMSFPEDQGLVILPLGDNQPAPLQALLQACRHGLLPNEISLFFRRIGQGHLAAAQYARAQQTGTELRIAYEGASSRAADLEAQLAEALQAVSKITAELELESRTRFAETAALTRHLETLRKGKQPAPANTELQQGTDAVRKTNAELRRQLEALRQGEQPPVGPSFRKLQQDVQRLRAENAALTQQVSDLRSSTSWRVTAPMRRVKSVFTRD